MKKAFIISILTAALIVISGCEMEDESDGDIVVDVSALTVEGDNGDNTLWGSDSSDSIYPYNGDDIIFPRGGNNDRVYITKNYTDKDTIRFVTDNCTTYVTIPSYSQISFVGKLKLSLLGAGATGTKRVRISGTSSDTLYLTSARYANYTNFYVKHKVGYDVLYKIVVDHDRSGSSNWVDISIVN